MNEVSDEVLDEIDKCLSISKLFGVSPDKLGDVTGSYSAQMQTQHLIDMSKLFALGDRRELLGKRMNKQKLECPECGTRQVQLVGYLNIKPAEWKCRHCKHEFNWEGGDE